MTLDQLPNGQTCEIVDCDGEDELGIRLMEMGFLPGEHVARTGQAPLGDPLEFRINGTRISLRRTEAARIQIQMPE